MFMKYPTRIGQFKVLGLFHGQFSLDSWTTWTGVFVKSFLQLCLILNYLVIDTMVTYYCKTFTVQAFCFLYTWLLTKQTAVKRPILNMDNRVNLVFLSIYWALKHKRGAFLQKKNVCCGSKTKLLYNIYFQKFYNQKPL